MKRLFKMLKACWDGIDIEKLTKDRNRWRKQYDDSVKKCARLQKALRKAQEK